jgi:hypothetical protein
MNSGFTFRTFKQKGEIRVFNRLAREWNKTVSTPAQFGRKGLTHATA